MNNITVVAISDIKIEETIKALLVSSKSINAYKSILFSSKNIRQKNCINHIKINPIKNLQDYSEFIIYELHKYISTSHVLITQWDGFVINESKWSDNFFNYDYIGAPFIPRDNDYSYSRNKKGKFYCIGNGGFSLRTKKLLEAPTLFKLKDDPELTNNHEDGFFSVLHRDFLEDMGFTWAPFNIAKNFSIEAPLDLHDLKELAFGFHGKKIYFFLKIKNIYFKIRHLFSKKNHIL